MPASEHTTAKRAAKSSRAEEPQSVASVIDALPGLRAALARSLREAALALEGTEERTLYDAFCQEWTPAFYLGPRQLFHIHNFQRGLRATIFVGLKSLEPIIVDSADVSPRVQTLLAETPASHTSKEFRLSISNAADVAEFMDMVQVKWTAARQEVSRPRRRG